MPRIRAVGRTRLRLRLPGAPADERGRRPESRCKRVVRIRRTCLRDGVVPEAVRARMAAQIDEAERIARADYVIRSGDEEPVLPKILELHGIFCRLR